MYFAMKKVLSIILVLCMTVSAWAQLNGDGYYRIRNLMSERYIIVTDDKGSIDAATTSADLGAVKLYKKFENVETDPGSILYIKQVNGQYRFQCQGTDTYKIIGYDLQLKKLSDGSYRAFQDTPIGRIFLADMERSSVVDGAMGTNDTGTNYRNWNILPVNTTDQYLGLEPELQHDGSFYTTFYASFPFTFASAGMTAYYVTLVENGKAVFAEVKDNTVPASMPIFVKCSATDPIDNKLNIAANSAKLPTNNLLGGVYFHNTSKSHKNLTPYNPETMRVLGVTSSGKLGFVKASIENLPANRAYLNVPVGTPDEVELMTQAEYDAYLAEMNRKVNVEVTATEGGSVTGGGQYKVNTEVSLTAVPSEGYYFGGWSDGTRANPYTFTATADVKLEAKFYLNSYRLTYMLDGLQYSSEFVDYGTALTPKDAPVKEGYTFSGWDGLPATMPAQDVIVNGSFAVNSYTLTYMLDGVVYAAESVAYGTALTLKDAPVKDGYIFSGWSELPTTMPAHDVIVTGQFASSISSIPTNDSLVDVYSVLGVRVKAQVPLRNLKAELPRGIYIVNGRKVVIK